MYAVLQALPFLVQYTGGQRGEYPMPHGPDGMMSPFGLWTIGLLVIAVAILIGYFASRGKSDNTESPLETLNRRYAAGEIDEDEYRRMKRNILEH